MVIFHSFLYVYQRVNLTESYNVSRINPVSFPVYIMKDLFRSYQFFREPILQDQEQFSSISSHRLAIMKSVDQPLLSFFFSIGQHYE